MSTSISSSATAARVRASLSGESTDGAAWVAVLALSVAITALVARQSPVAFLIAAVAVLVAVGFSAWHWPLPTLVGAAVATLADPEITPRILPDGVNLGPIGVSEPLLLVTGLVVGAHALRHRTVLTALRDPVTWLGLLFTALALVSAVVNDVPLGVAALGLVMTLDAIAIYFVARMLPVGERGAAAAVGAVVAVAVSVAILGILQAMLDPALLGFSARAGQFGEGTRISSFIGSPNMVAAVIGLALPFAVYGVRHLPRRRLRWLAAVALILLAWALLLTFSRGAWLAVGLGGIVGVLLVDWRSLPTLVLAIAVAWLAVTVMPRGLLVPEPAAGGGGSGQSGSGGGIIGSAADRIGNLADRNDTRGRFLRDGIRIIEDHPLLGVGPGRYGGAAATIIPTPVYEEYGAEMYGYRTVHNFWLHLLGESGALGTAVFLTMLVALGIRFVREAWRSTGLRFVVVAGASTMLLIVGLHSLTEMIFEGNMPVLIVWLVLGLASLLAPSRPIFWRRSAAASA